jgi:hypothetical protein
MKIALGAILASALLTLSVAPVIAQRTTAQKSTPSAMQARVFAEPG